MLCKEDSVLRLLISSDEDLIVSLLLSFFISLTFPQSFLLITYSFLSTFSPSLTLYCIAWWLCKTLGNLSHRTLTVFKKPYPGSYMCTWFLSSFFSGTYPYSVVSFILNSLFDNLFEISFRFASSWVVSCLSDSSRDSSKSSL